MYFDTVSTSHLSFGIDQLHFIQCISVLRSFYHSFSCCNETFLAPLVVRFIVQSHFVIMCACSKLRAPCTLSHAHDRFSSELVSCPDPTSKEEKGLVNLGLRWGISTRQSDRSSGTVIWLAYHRNVTRLYICTCCISQIAYAIMLTNQIPALHNHQSPVQPYRPIRSKLCMA